MPSTRSTNVGILSVFHRWLRILGCRRARRCLGPRGFLNRVKRKGIGRERRASFSRHPGSVFCFVLGRALLGRLLRALRVRVSLAIYCRGRISPFFPLEWPSIGVFVAMRKLFLGMRPASSWGASSPAIPPTGGATAVCGPPATVLERGIVFYGAQVGRLVGADFVSYGKCRSVDTREVLLRTVLGVLA